MTATTDPDLDLLRGLLKDAAVIGPFPWGHRDNDIYDAAGCRVATATTALEAALIVALVNAAPALLDKASRTTALEAENARLREAAQPFSGVADDLEDCLDLITDPDRRENVDIGFGGMRAAEMDITDFLNLREALLQGPQS